MLIALCSVAAIFDDRDRSPVSERRVRFLSLLWIQISWLHATFYLLVSEPGVCHLRFEPERLLLCSSLV